MADTIHIHTDGSSDNGKKDCGWAFCLSTKERSDVIHQDSGYNPGTNNVGELKGVINALHFVYGNYKPKNVIVYTDSRDVSDTVYFDYYGWFQADPEIKDRKNRELWIELKNRLHIMKMRGITVDIRCLS